jgi:hypothetical protein
VKTFSPKLHFGKEFSKKEVIWSLLAGRLTELYNQHQMRNEKTCLVFRERRGFFPRLGEHLFDAQGFATFKEVDKPHSVLLFRCFVADNLICWPKECQFELERIRSLIWRRL